LDAQIETISVRGKRMIPASSFFTGLFETGLAADEILAAVHVALPQAGAVHGFHELARRSGDYAIVGLAAQGRLVGQRFAELRLGYFSVGSRATLALNAASVLVGGGSLEQAAEALGLDLEPHDDLQASGPTRLHLARVVLRRVLTPMMEIAA
jgi:carbon-monoxide dehydrogenase medium subunit